MKRQKTVLFLTPRFYPQIGGVETHVLRVSEELAKDGYKIIIITEALDDSDKVKWQSRYKNANVVDKNDWAVKSSKSILDLSNIKTKIRSNEDVFSESAGTKNIIVYRIPKVNKGRLKKFFIWRWFLKNRKIVRGVDIVHCHDVFFWYLPLRFIFLRKPVYITFHGYESYPIPIKNILIRKLSENLSWGNICIGEFIRKWYGAKPDFVSYGGVDMNRIKYKVTSSKFNNKKIKILFIGRLEKENGVAIYLSALKQLKDDKVDFEFEVCGDGTLSKETTQYGKVYGFVKNVAKYLLDADIVFVSSYLSLLQAMKYSKNIIAAYDNPLKEDYLRMTPFHKWIHIVNSEKDIKNIVEQIMYSSTNNLDMRENAYKWARSNSWSKVSGLYTKLWKT